MTLPVAEYVSDDGVFVAGRGESASDGLHFFSQKAGQWSGIHLAEVVELAALCWHPTLSVIYGLSGLGRGLLHVWEVTGAASGSVETRATLDCGGEIPCDLAVDPSGRMLVAANFGTDRGGGSLTVWSLDDAGTPTGSMRTVPLGEGSGARGAGQLLSHPHQIVFHRGRLFVPDYGADQVRVFEVDAATAAIHEVSPLLAPPGSAPRHMAFVGDDRFVASGELSGDILVGSRDRVVSGARGTGRSGPATGRHPINYPGDIKARDGIAYFANRGYDTIATFAVDAHPIRLLAERDSAVRWAQHLLVTDSHLLIAGWDSGTVAAMPLTDGVPGESSVLFECVGAGWLLAGRPSSHA